MTLRHVRCEAAVTLASPWLARSRGLDLAKILAPPMRPTGSCLGTFAGAGEYMGVPAPPVLSRILSADVNQMVRRLRLRMTLGNAEASRPARGKAPPRGSQKRRKISLLVAIRLSIKHRENELTGIKIAAAFTAHTRDDMIGCC
jgi:hypothetical protein